MRYHVPVVLLLALALAAGCSRSTRPDLAALPSGGAPEDGTSPIGDGGTPPISNVPPTTWWAGPDPALWPISTDGSGARSVDVVDWGRFETVPAWPPDGRGYFGPDSFASIPKARRPVAEDVQRRTFYEIWGDRIYARSEGETVHLGAWLVFVNGGFDRDSRYAPMVDPLDPALPPRFLADPIAYAVLHELGYVNSPVAFRSRITYRLPGGLLSQAPSTRAYPNFDPYSVFRQPQVAGYVQSIYEGKAYVAVAAQDAEGLRDASAIQDAVGIADRVDGGGGSSADRAARHRIIVFNVSATP